MFSVIDKDEYRLNLIENHKILMDSLQDLFDFHRRLNGDKKLTLLCIKKIYGLNVLTLDKGFLGNNYYIISELADLSRKDRDIIIRCAYEWACGTATRIDKVEVRL